MTNPVRITDPGTVAATVPYLLGFQPAPGAAVVIGLHTKHVRVTSHLRPEQLEDGRTTSAACAVISDAYSRAGVTGVLVIAYADALTEAEATAATIAGLLDFPATDVLGIAGGRWRSALCQSVKCCPAEGTPIPDDTEAAAAFTLEGVAPLPDRDALALEIAPSPFGEVADPLDALTLADALDTAKRDAIIGTAAAMIEAGNLEPARATRERFARAARTADDPRRWAHAVTAAAMVAYLLGEGGRANVYAEKVREIIPDEHAPSLLGLLETALAHAIDPGNLRASLATL